MWFATAAGDEVLSGVWRQHGTTRRRPKNLPNDVVESHQGRSVVLDTPGLPLPVLRTIGWLGDRVSANGFQLMADNFIESYVLVGVFSVLVVALLACLLPTRPERVVGPFLGMALLIPLAVVALSLSEAGLLGYGIWFAIILVLVFCAYAVYSLQQYVQTERDSRFQMPSEKKRGTGVPTFRLPAVIGGVPSVVLLIVLWVHFGEWNIGLLVFLAGQFAVMSGLTYGALWVRYTFRQRELGKSKGVEITDATRAEDLSDSGSQPLRFSSYLSDVERHNSERWSASEPSDQSGERVLEGHANPRTSNRRANRRQLPLSVQLVGGLASVLVVAVVAVVIVLQVNDDTGDLAKMEQAALQRRSGPIMLTQPDGSVIASGYGYSSTTESTVTTSPVHDNPPGLPVGQGSKVPTTLAVSEGSADLTPEELAYLEETRHVVNTISYIFYEREMWLEPSDVLGTAALDSDINLTSWVSTYLDASAAGPSVERLHGEVQHMLLAWQDFLELAQEYERTLDEADMNAALEVLEQCEQHCYDAWEEGNKVVPGLYETGEGV